MMRVDGFDRDYIYIVKYIYKSVSGIYAPEISKEHQPSAIHPWLKRNRGDVFFRVSYLLGFPGLHSVPKKHGHTHSEVPESVCWETTWRVSSQY